MKSPTRIISVNVNGIRAASRYNIFNWFAKVDADVICLQEVKAQQSQLTDPIFNPEGYHRYCVDAEKKGYSGVAIYSKKKPNNIITHLDFTYSNTEARYLQADFDNTSIISLYLPSGTSGEERQAIKYQFMDFFLQHMRELKKQQREVVICGDWNIAHQKIDIKNWRGNQKNSGFLPEERAWLDKVFGEEGFIDAFRVINQEPDQYTWWSNRGQAYAKNVGWRIDYQVITPGLRDKIRAVDIYKGEKFSDHAPLIIDYDHPL